MKKFIILLLFSPLIFANDLFDFMANFNTLEAKFVQVIDGDKEYGVLKLNQLKRQMKLHITKPYEKIITLNNNKVISYEVAIKSANIIEYEPNGFIELLLGNDMSEIVDFGNHYGYGNALFYLENKKLVKIINSDNGDTINFINFKFNPKFKPDEFNINLPEDTDILDETY